MPRYVSRSKSSSSGGLLGSGRRLFPARAKTMGAQRRVSELNIMSHEGLVSTTYTLENIYQAQKNTLVTKLELEDLVNRDGDSTALFVALQNLLTRDDNRAWQYIKFVDTLSISNEMNAAIQWDQYAKKKQALWDHIRRYAKNKPIMFEVKLEVAMGTTVHVLRGMIRVLYDLNTLTRVECGGALYGIRKAEVPDKLADLCRDPMDDSGSSSNRSSNGGCLHDTIVFTLSCMVPDAAPVNKADVFLRKCNRRLKGLAERMTDKKCRIHDIHQSDTNHSDNSSPDRLDESLSIHELEMASGREQRRSLGSASLSSSSGRLHRSARRIRRRPEKPSMRRTKSCAESGSRNEQQLQHHREERLTNEEQANGSSDRLNRSVNRIERKSHDRLHHSSRSCRRTKSLMERGSPDYDWIHNRASGNLRVFKNLCSEYKENEFSKYKDEPDFRWDRQSRAHTPASEPRRSVSRHPPSRANSYAASTA